MTTIQIDFETRSVIDLARSGVHVYAAHPTTDAWCMAWASGDLEPGIWRLGEPLPPELRYHLEQPDVEVRAWNAMFERVIWNTIGVPRYGFPALPLRAWHCTMVEASAMGLPRSLEEAATVLRVPQQKDTDGWRLMVRMARPRSFDKGKPIWWDVPERLDILHNYCKQDVRTEREVAKRVRRLIPIEQEMYWRDQTINDRGVLVDVPLVRASKKIVDLALDRANVAIREATGGAVADVKKVGDLTEWLKTQGIDEGGVRKSIVRELLEGDLPSPVRVALEARAEAGRASVAKLDAMLRAIGEDERARGMFQFNGAGTGRWAGRLIQFQNFFRPTVKRVEQFVDDIMAGAFEKLDLFAPPTEIIASLLRGHLRAAPGKHFEVGDFSQIEARVLAWLAGQDDLVELFRNKGKVYETFAAKLYKVPVEQIGKDDPRRQFGKNMVLGCGYQMGADAYQAQAKEQMGVEITDEFAQETIDAYRALVPRIKQLWFDLNEASIDAVKLPGKVFEVRGCKFTKRGAWLWLVLPSGRPLAFAGPKLVVRPVSFPAKTCEKCQGGLLKSAKGLCANCAHVSAPTVVHREQVAVWGVNSVTRQWSPYMLYGGLLTENIVQALARDLLRDAIVRCERRDMPLVMHAHDEIVCEVGPDVENEHLIDAMRELPVWAAGLPVDAEGYSAERYRK